MKTYQLFQGTEKRLNKAFIACLDNREGEHCLQIPKRQILKE